MGLSTVFIILALAFFVVFFGRIFTHALKFIFYILLIFLVVVFVFGISFTEIINFLKELIFMSF